ncbi:MAG: NUDIX domain-containing protein [Candidatus Hodarchaeales archaeon]
MNNEKPYTPFSYSEFVKRYYVHRVAALGVIVKDNQLLLTYQFRGREKSWGLPGGLLEKGEPLKKALEREILEETNVVIEPVGILAVSDWAGESIYEDDPNSHSGLGIVFGANYISGTPKPDELEIFDVKFVPEEEFEEFNMSSFTKKCFNSFNNNKLLLMGKEKFYSEERYLYGYGPFTDE